jgi:Undecaprenyl-phosphate galactose phosphotransferase WbaP
MPIKGSRVRKSRHATSSLVLIDLFSFCFSFGLAILIRWLLNPVMAKQLMPLSNYWLLIAFNILIMFLIFLLMGLYRGYGMVAVIELRNITQSILISYIILAFSAYLVGEVGRLSRVVFGLSLVFCLILVPLMRFVIYNRFSRLRNWGIRVAVIASKEEYPDITTRLGRIRRLGFNPERILCVDFDPGEKHLFMKIPVEKYTHEACQRIRLEGIDVAFYTSQDLGNKDKVLQEISRIFPTMYYVLPESRLSSLWLETSDLIGRPALKVRYHLLEKIPNHIKSLIERTLAVILLILSLPITLIIMLVMKIENKGPLFFYQNRLGLNGKPFNLIKFRTMIQDAELNLEKYLDENPDAREEYLRYRKLENDPRVTGVGAFMRKFSLDEIPQFLNVVRGEMNLIGPRAYMLDELDPQDEITKTILQVKPGVTGWWQVMGRNEATFEERQRLDLYYITNWSLWLDYYIMIKSVWIIFSGQGM